MKQIIVRRMTLTDLIFNIFYKIRFWFFRIFLKRKLKNISDKIKENKTLVFEDNFDKVSWSIYDDTKWKQGTEYHPNHLLYHYGPPELDGNNHAKFTIKYNPKTYGDVTLPFEVSLLSSIQSFTQKHGRFECRMTLPFDKGAWPAFWLWGSTWPPEIDIIECYGRKDGKKSGVQEINLIYGHREEGTWDRTKTWKVKIEKKNTKHKFHEFVCEWHANKVEMFTDGIKIFRYSKKDILDKWFNVDDANMRIVVNQAIQGHGEYVNKDDKDYTSLFLVDYVRAYKND